MLHVARGEDDMLAAHDAFGPDAIVAPFLTKRVPERLWKNNMTCPVLIVHPGVRGDRGVSSIDWALKGAYSTLIITRVCNFGLHNPWQAFARRALLTRTRPLHNVLSCR